MQSEQTANNGFVANNAGAVQFCIVAGVLFTALYMTYNKLFVGTDLFYAYIEWGAESARRMLEWIGVEAALEHSTQDGARISELSSSGIGTQIIIDKNSDLTATLMLLPLAIAVWPGSALKKVIAIALGLAFIVFVNVARLALMFIVDIYFPLDFKIFNEYAMPAGLTVLSLLCFLLWVRWSGKHPNLSN